MDEKVEESLQFIKEKTGQYRRVATICSFGKDSIVATHLIQRIKPDIQVLWIRTPFLPKETLRFADQVRDAWSLNLHPVESRSKEKKILYRTDPKQCCQIFKVEPIMKEVRRLGLEAWFSGLRSMEGEKRGTYTREWPQDGFIRLHPILDWTEADVWRYTAVNKLPVHPWYGLGYRSLGCGPCSAPNVWSSERGGRWRDTEMAGGYCGIHCTPPYLKEGD